MTDKIEPTEYERKWLASHGFSPIASDERAWAYDADGLVIDLFLENSVGDMHEWLVSWYFDFSNGARLENDDVCGLASPEDAVAAVVSAVSKFDAAGKLLHAAVSALYGEEMNK